jgi:hypothetical protein
LSNSIAASLRRQFSHFGVDLAGIAISTCPFRVGFFHLNYGVSMSEFTTIRDDIEAPFLAIAKAFEGTTIGNAIEADYKAALAELKSIGVTDLEQAVKTIGVAVLGGLATGGETGAIAAGIAAAPAAFEAAGKDISAQTTRTLVNTVLNQVSAVSAAPTAGTATGSTPAAS